MEEKNSYTLNHSDIDESDANKPESFALLEGEDAAVNENDLTDEKKVEKLSEPNENTALTDGKKETIKDEKDVTQTNLPTKNRFLRLFDRKTIKNEPTEQNGNGVNQPEPEEGVAQTATKRRFVMLQNPFASKKNEIAAEEVGVPKEKTSDELVDEKKGKFFNEYKFKFFSISFNFVF